MVSAATAESRLCPVARFSPAQTRTVSQFPAKIASAACFSMTAGEPPPTATEAQYRGCMPRILGDNGTKHEIWLGHRICGESVDIFQCEPCVVEGPFAGLRVEADARHVWNFADIGFSNPGDDNLVTK